MNPYQSPPNKVIRRWPWWKRWPWYAWSMIAAMAFGCLIGFWVGDIIGYKRATLHAEDGRWIQIQYDDGPIGRAKPKAWRYSPNR